MHTPSSPKPTVSAAAGGIVLCIDLCIDMRIQGTWQMPHTNSLKALVEAGVMSTGAPIDHAVGDADIDHYAQAELAEAGGIRCGVGPDVPEDVRRSIDLLLSINPSKRPSARQLLQGTVYVVSSTAVP